MDSGKILSAMESLLITILGAWLASPIFNLFRRIKTLVLNVLRRIEGWRLKSLISEAERKIRRTSHWTFTPAAWKDSRLLILLVGIFLGFNLLAWGSIAGGFYAVTEFPFSNNSLAAQLLLQLRHAPMIVKAIVAFLFLLSCVFSCVSYGGLGLLYIRYQELLLHTKPGREKLKKELSQLRRKQQEM